jgi:hypothetical protein
MVMLVGRVWCHVNHVDAAQPAFDGRGTQQGWLTWSCWRAGRGAM